MHKNSFFAQGARLECFSGFGWISRGLGDPRTHELSVRGAPELSREHMQIVILFGLVVLGYLDSEAQLARRHS